MVKTIIALMLTMLNTINVAPSEKAGNTQHYEDVRPIHIACGEGYEYECVENGSSIAIEASYPVVMLRYDDENNFSKLNKALADNNKSTKEYQLKFIKDNLEFARESYDVYDEYYHPFESRVKPLIHRGDTVVTSILYSGFTYMGGMNGDSYYYGENYDTQTGKELNLFDVVNDRSSLSYALREQLEDIADSNVNLDEVINAEKEYSWTLDYNGITFYFMPYAISPIATDVVVVTLSNKEYPEVLKNEYKVTPKAYGVELNPDVPFFYDVNGDGILDEIRAGGYASGDEYPGCVNLSVNGESITQEDWFFDYEATFVHNSDGRNYIYYEI